MVKYGKNLKVRVLRLVDQENSNFKNRNTKGRNKNFQRIDVEVERVY